MATYWTTADGAVVRSLSCVETAKLVRAALKATFPGVGFAVRSARYAGGASIDVRWVDGPTAREVEAVTWRYQGASFDPTIDLMEYHDGTLDGERVHFGADFIQCEREYGADFLRAAAAAVAARYGVPAPEVREETCGGRVYAWVDTSGPAINDHGPRTTAGDLAVREASETRG